MKKAVILVLALFWAVSALAQYAVAPNGIRVT